MTGPLQDVSREGFGAKCANTSGQWTVQRLRPVASLITSKGLICNTHFSLEKVVFLCKVLEKKFGLLAKPRSQKSSKGKVYYQIYVSGKSFELACSILKPNILAEMLYKFPSQRKKDALTILSKE